jgi:predicted nucleic acid-binding protein
VKSLGRRARFSIRTSSSRASYTSYELFGRLAIEHEVLSLIWSDELLNEAQRVLVDRKPLPSPSAERWVSYLRTAFPDGHVDLATRTVEADLSSFTSDADDEHICALALAGEASLLLTLDHGYERAALAARGVEVAEPDEFLSGLLDEQPSVALAVVETQAAAWGGGRPVGELIDALERARVPRFAAGLRNLLGG